MRQCQNNIRNNIPRWATLSLTLQDDREPHDPSARDNAEALVLKNNLLSTCQPD